jgi:hypothetical protein
MNDEEEEESKEKTVHYVAAAPSGYIPALHSFLWLCPYRDER